MRTRSCGCCCSYWTWTSISPRTGSFSPVYVFNSRVDLLRGALGNKSLNVSSERMDMAAPVSSSMQSNWLLTSKGICIDVDVLPTACNCGEGRWSKGDGPSL